MRTAPTKTYSGVSQEVTVAFWDRTVYATKKISVQLKDSLGAVLNTVQVKYAIFEFAGALPYNNSFMALTSKGIYTTDTDGIFEVIYTGSAAIGSYAYLAIIHPHNSPAESVLWKVAIE